MATFTVNTTTAAETVMSKLDLSAGPHNFTYDTNLVMYIQNDEAGPITVNFSGDGVTVFNCPGYDNDIDVSAGNDVVVASGDTLAYNVTARRAYMGDYGNNVTVTITGASGSSFGYLTQK